MRRGATPRRSISIHCKPIGRFVVIVAEKPKAARKIAYSLGKPVKCSYYNVPYWVIMKNGHKFFVVPSAGHLFGPHSDRRGFPVYDYEWRPLYEFDRSAKYTYKYYKLMNYILPNAQYYINACDYDIEGSVIGYTIIEFFGDIRKYKRMKFSSLSVIEIKNAFKNLHPPDTLLVEAGKARHEIDWLWGINVSRALMYAVRKAAGRKIILSAGRVQSPTIVEASRRWEEINLALPTPAFSLVLRLEYDGIEFNAYPYNWKPETIIDLKMIINKLKKEKILRVLRSNGSSRKINPPPAFNLGDLQKEAARIFKFSPMKTQKIAEDLYLDALISYPRTNSQRLPPTINYKNIILNLKKIKNFNILISELIEETRGVLTPVQGRKDDPAHPAIHPTGEIPRNLDRDHWLIYEMIVRRFLAAFAMESIISNITILLSDSGNHLYVARGTSVDVLGWMKYYHYSMPKEEKVPYINKNEKVNIIDIISKKEWRHNAPNLSRTSLLVWMEREKIGTEATRARIIETLFKRGYLANQGGYTVVTDLGMMVSSIIEELFPDLSKPELTRKLEYMLEQIWRGRKTRQEIIDTARREIDRLIKTYNTRLEEVGDRLAYSIGLKNPPAKCPICGRMTYDPSYGFCVYHTKALNRLRQEIPKIARKLNVSEYKAMYVVSRLKSRAGKWVIEVAQYFVSNGLSLDDNGDSS